MIKRVGTMIDFKQSRNKTPIYAVGSPGPIDFQIGPTETECTFVFEIDRKEIDASGSYIVDNNQKVYTITQDDLLFSKFEKCLGRLVIYNQEKDTIYGPGRIFGSLQFGDFATMEQCKEIAAIEYIENKGW